jgi:hypothetical protein
MSPKTAILFLNVGLCGQLGEQLQQQGRRLAEVERLARIIGFPIKIVKRLVRALFPFAKANK